MLVDALLEGGLLDALVQRLGALNEEIPEEATAVYNALSVAENCIELKSEVAEQAGSQSGLLEWLLRRLRPKAEVDANKQYAAEVLAVVLQAGGDAARRRFMDLGGVDRALQSVAPYRSRDPGTTEEEEFVENVFNVLCAVIMDPAAKDAFVEAEGVELMVLILKGRTAARTGALKCLDFATTGCPGACDRAVDQGALGSIFALFMGKLKVKGGKGGAKRQDDAVQAEEEERAVSVISNLLAGVTSKARRDRVAAKFVENEFEKCDRLMEIYFRYGARVEAEEARLAEEADEDDVDEDELLLSRLDAGLYTLQQCALVAAELWAVGDIGVRRRLLALLHQRSRSLAALREVLLEHRATLAAEGEAEAEAEAAAAQERQKRVSHVTGLLEALGHKDGAEEVGQAEHNGGVDAGGESGGKRRREDSLGGEEEQRASRQKVDNASS